MPPAHHPHDTHGGTAIHDNDDAIFDDDKPVKFDQQHLDHVRSFRVIEHSHRLTVADLLDYYDTDDFSASDLIARSSDDDRESANRIRAALIALAILSPEERTEFDRRTT